MYTPQEVERMKQTLDQLGSPLRCGHCNMCTWNAYELGMHVREIHGAVNKPASVCRVCGVRHNRLFRIVAAQPVRDFVRSLYCHIFSYLYGGAE